MVLNRGVHKILCNFLILKDSRGEEVAPLAGLEPATHGLGIRCSIRTELQGYFLSEYQFNRIGKVISIPTLI